MNTKTIILKYSFILKKKIGAAIAAPLVLDEVVNFLNFFVHDGFLVEFRLHIGGKLQNIFFLASQKLCPQARLPNGLAVKVAVNAVGLVNGAAVKSLCNGVGKNSAAGGQRDFGLFGVLVKRADGENVLFHGVRPFLCGVFSCLVYIIANQNAVVNTFFEKK